MGLSDYVPYISRVRVLTSLCGSAGLQSLLANTLCSCPSHYRGISSMLEDDTFITERQGEEGSLKSLRESGQDGGQRYSTFSEPDSVFGILAERGRGMPRHLGDANSEGRTQIK